MLRRIHLVPVEPATTRIIPLVCAWCGLVKAGPELGKRYPKEQIGGLDGYSHGICDECTAEVMRQLDH